MRRTLNIMKTNGEAQAYFNLPDPRLAALQKEYAANWIWRAVAAMIEVRGFQPTLEWMSDRLSVSKAEVAQALEGLEGMGIIRKTASGYERILKYVYYSDRDLDRGNLMQSHVLITQQILNRLDPAADRLPVCHKTGFLSSNASCTEEFHEKLTRLLKEYLQKSSLEKPDNVYAFSFSNLSLLTPESEET